MSSARDALTAQQWRRTPGSAGVRTVVAGLTAQDVRGAGVDREALPATAGALGMDARRIDRPHSAPRAQLAGYAGGYTAGTLSGTALDTIPHYRIRCVLLGVAPRRLNSAPGQAEGGQVVPLWPDGRLAAASTTGGHWTLQVRVDGPGAGKDARNGGPMLATGTSTHPRTPPQRSDGWFEPPTSDGRRAGRHLLGRADEMASPGGTKCASRVKACFGMNGLTQQGGGPARSDVGHGSQGGGTADLGGRRTQRVRDAPVAC